MKLLNFCNNSQYIAFSRKKLHFLFLDKRVFLVGKKETKEHGKWSQNVVDERQQFNDFIFLK